MATLFRRKSFDGVERGLTSFELHIDGEQVGSSEGIYPTPDVAQEDIKRLVYYCQHHDGYAVDRAVDFDTFKYVGQFPNLTGTVPFMRTKLCETEDGARELIDRIWIAILRMAEQIPIDGPVYDAPTDVVDR